MMNVSNAKKHGPYCFSGNFDEHGFRPALKMARQTSHVPCGITEMERKLYLNHSKEHTSGRTEENES